jgi:hypothetical protein
MKTHVQGSPVAAEQVFDHENTVENHVIFVIEVGFVKSPSTRFSNSTRF